MPPGDPAISIIICRDRRRKLDGLGHRKFSQEFKQDAVKLVIDQGMKCTEAARDLGVDQNT
jgi:transposase-like protein